MKKKIQQDISLFLKNLTPVQQEKVRIAFTWVEKTQKRDLDNVCFSKKFILDAMVELGIIKNDSQNYIAGFTDNFCHGDEYGVFVEIITEEDNGEDKRATELPFEKS